MKRNNLIFGAVLVLPIVCSALMIIEFYDISGSSWYVPGETVAIMIVLMAPVLVQDISSFGQLTVAAVVGGLMFIGPRRYDTRMILFSYACCAIGWLLFAGLSVLILKHSYHSEEVRLTLQRSGAVRGLATLDDLSTNVRIFYLAVAAGLTGMWFRKH